jgi:hypothetical protein
LEKEERNKRRKTKPNQTKQTPPRVLYNMMVVTATAISVLLWASSAVSAAAFAPSNSVPMRNNRVSFRFSFRFRFRSIGHLLTESVLR